MEFLFLIFGLGLIFLGIHKVYQYNTCRVGCLPREGEILTYEKQVGTKNQTLYRAVIKFQNLDGKSYFLVSPIATSTFTGTLGQRVKLLLDPKDALKAYLGTGIELVAATIIIVLGFILTGIFMKVAKVSTVDVPLTLVVVAIMGFNVWRISKKIKKATTENNQVYEMYKKRRTFFNGLPEVYPEQTEWKSSWLSEDEYVQIVVQKNRLFAWLKPVLLLAALGLGYFSFHFYSKTQHFLQTAIRTTGQVVELESSYTSKGRTVYSPIVEFNNSIGEKVRFKDRLSSNPPDYEVGETAPVLYDPANAQNAQVDAGIWNYRSAMIFSILALLVGFFAWVMKPIPLDQRLNLKATALSKTAGK